MGPAEAEGAVRSTRVEEMGEALPVLCGRDARVPGWASSRDVIAANEVQELTWNPSHGSDEDAQGTALDPFCQPPCSLPIILCTMFHL